MLTVKSKIKKLAFAVWIVAALWLVINIVSIIQEYNRDSKSVLIPLNDSGEISTIDVSGYEDEDIDSILKE